MRSNQIFALGAVILSSSCLILTRPFPHIQDFYVLVLALFLAVFFCLLVQPRETPTAGYAIATFVVGLFLAACLRWVTEGIPILAAVLLFLGAIAAFIACVALGVVAYYREHPELQPA